MAPPYILESAEDGGKDGRVLQGGVYGAWGVMQGDLLSPTIFSVVVDAVVRHWVSVMVEGAED